MFSAFSRILDTQTHLLCVFECANMVGNRDEGLIPTVGDVEPPPLLLLLGEVKAVDGVRHF